MPAIVLTLPALIALGCLALNRAVATRRLGLVAAATLLAYAAALGLLRARGGLPQPLAELTWLQLDAGPLVLRLVIDQHGWVFALLTLLGGGLALLALALAVPPRVRGFGGLFAAALAALYLNALGQLNQAVLLLPIAWAAVGVLSFAALRASGAFSAQPAPSLVLLAGLGSALLLLATALLGPAAAALAWLVLALLAFGAPPLHGAWHEFAAAPAPLAGALLALGLPLGAGVALLRLLASAGLALSPGWQLAYTLLGVAAMAACAAGALSTTRLRQILAWQLSAQLGLLLVCAGQGGAALTLAAPALLLNAALTTLVGFLAVAVIEHRAGSDDLAEIAAGTPLIGPGTLLLLSTAAAAGLPGLWGFWPRRWLFDQLAAQAPWALAPLLAASGMLLLAGYAPLAACWRAGALPAGEQALTSSSTLDRMTRVAALAALPLAVLGIAPQLAWAGWLAGMQPAGVAAASWLPGWPGLLASALALLALLSIPLLLLRARGAATASANSDEPMVMVAPQALGASLGGLAWLADAGEVFAGIWQLLIGASTGLRRTLALFEQRYYLAGLLIALIVVLLLFIQ